MRDDIKKIIEEQYRKYVLEPFNRDNPKKLEECRGWLTEKVGDYARRGNIGKGFASRVFEYLGK